MSISTAANNVLAQTARVDRLATYLQNKHGIRDGMEWIDGALEEVAGLLAGSVAGVVSHAVFLQVSDHLGNARRGLKRADDVLENGLAMMGGGGH
jgi:hypothetical protein